MNRDPYLEDKLPALVNYMLLLEECVRRFAANVEELEDAKKRLSQYERIV